MINHRIFRTAKRLQYATDPEEKKSSVSRPDGVGIDVSCQKRESNDATFDHTPFEVKTPLSMPEGPNEVTMGIVAGSCEKF